MDGREREGSAEMKFKRWRQKAVDKEEWASVIKGGQGSQRAVELRNKQESKYVRKLLTTDPEVIPIANTLCAETVTEYFAFCGTESSLFYSQKPHLCSVMSLMNQHPTLTVYFSKSSVIVP